MPAQEKPLQIFGEPPSRATRVIWLAKELSLDFEVLSVDILGGAHLHESFRAINPLAQVPAIQDQEVSMGESFAINLYLAHRYGETSRLWGSSFQEIAQIYQWSLAAAALDNQMSPLVINRVILPPQAANENVANAAEKELIRTLHRVGQFLGERQYLTGNRFTLSDLQMVSVAVNCLFTGVDLNYAGENVEPWIRRCIGREHCGLSDQPPSSIGPEELAKLAEIRSRL